IFTRKIPVGKKLVIPSAHAEGKFLLPKDREEEMLREMIENDQIVFRYVDPDGNYAGYPWNPNGSIYNIAGICNSYGNVLGMMPHPERVFYRITHPDWTRYVAGGREDKKVNVEEYGDGYHIFKACVDYLRRKF
ncbi:MAG: phosphoribosylformylglycinamidine synthase subunit PurQ, partial [Thermoplasmata archaeon]